MKFSRGSVLIAVAAAAVAAGAVVLVRGDRYRLLIDAQAERCWEAVHGFAASTSSLRPRRIARTSEREVRIDYQLDRVLGGKPLEAVCTFDGESLAAMTLNGMPVDLETLRSLDE